MTGALWVDAAGSCVQGTRKEHNMGGKSGRHFLQIPGPTNVPDRVLRAISFPTIDHRGPEFGALGLRVLSGLREVFKTKQPVIIYTSSGTGPGPGICRKWRPTA